MRPRFLATGNTFNVIARSFRMGDSTCAACIYTTLDAIWEELGPVYLGPPTSEMWAASAEEFRRRWRFPNCVAAIDGKHVQLQCPNNTGSMYFNYKGTFSTVMLALVDASLKFRYISVGSAGKEGDAGIFADSDLGKRLENNRLHLPAPEVLGETNNGEAVPHVIVGDEAFPLKPYLMRPFPAAKLTDPECFNFNIRLSKARRVVECAFGILVQRFRCFRGPLQVQPENASRIVRAACVLHNMLREKVLTTTGGAAATLDLPPEQEQAGASAFASLPGRIASNMYSRNAAEVRDMFKTFLSRDGPSSRSGH